MGFIRAGFRAAKNLNELVNTTLALQYLGVAENIKSTPSEETGEITQNVVRARVVQFQPDGTQPKELGETLVFQQIIARELQDKPFDWHLGVLTEIPQRADESRTVYRLTPPEDSRVYERQEAAMRSAGLA